MEILRTLIWVVVRWQWHTENSSSSRITIGAYDSMSVIPQLKQKWKACMRRPHSILLTDLRATAKPLPMLVSWMEGGEETRKSRERRGRNEKCPLGRESTRHVELVFYEGTYKRDTFTIVKVTGSQARRLGWDYWLYLCKWQCPPKIHMLKPTPPMWWHLEVGL